jgi:hypothetical protein
MMIQSPAGTSQLSVQQVEQLATQMSIQLPAGKTWASADNQPQDGKLSDAEFTAFFIEISS